jgi:hypothetical protein
LRTENKARADCLWREISRIWRRSTTDTQTCKDKGKQGHVQKSPSGTSDKSGTNGKSYDTAFLIRRLEKLAYRSRSKMYYSVLNPNTHFEELLWPSGDELR